MEPAVHVSNTEKREYQDKDAHNDMPGYPFSRPAHVHPEMKAHAIHEPDDK